MAEVNPQVMEMIRDELKKNPDVSNQDLFEKARSLDPAIGELSARQFNARYPLQVKRTMSPRKPAGRRGSTRPRGRAARDTGSAGGTAAKEKPATPDARDKVRRVLLELARDVAGAEGRGAVVDVVMGIDRYVDRVMKASG
jgi:hypothetical protein